LGFSEFVLLNSWFHPKLYPADDAGSTACNIRDSAPRPKIAFKIPFRAHKPAAYEPKCRRIANPA
jgi:hypothetical protein